MIDAELTPDYLPARMLNEFVYCPRLFYYEWVEGVWAESRDTVEGSLRHAKLERKEDPLPSAATAEGPKEQIHSRSVTLSSEVHRLIAKLDLIEGTSAAVIPVDYKHGSPRIDDRDGSLQAWDPDRVQLAAQALILRENGYPCTEGVIYYVATKQRVRVPIDDALVRLTLDSLERALSAAAKEQIPPPLVDSPKCPRCSLVGICLPEETRACMQSATPSGRTRQLLLFDVGERPQADAQPPARTIEEIRRLVPARDDLRPLYLNTQGLRVGKSGEVLQIHARDKLVEEVRLGEICQLNLFGGIQITTQAIQALCMAEIPIVYFSMGGWFYGMTHGLGVKNIYLRREQFRWADIPTFCLRFARALVAGKIRNQRTLLQRNHVEPPRLALAHLKEAMNDAERAESLEELLGIEGNAARIYFANFAGMIKTGGTDDPASGGGDDDPFGRPGAAGESAAAASSNAANPFPFNFLHRNRRPPRDPINALLSLAYSVLAKDLAIVCSTVGFDPFLGFYHQPRFQRAALALDLMEPFRPLIADSAVLSAVNTRMITPRDFIRVGPAVALKTEGRKRFFRAYEQRMDTLVTHPLFGYRINYRRVLEIQTRLLARVVTGEMTRYPVFTTR